MKRPNYAVWRMPGLFGHSGAELEMRSGRAFGVDADQQLQVAVAISILWRRCDRVRLAPRVAVTGDQERLSGLVGKWLAVEVDSDHAR